MVGWYRLDVDLIYSKLQTANSVLVFVICVYGVVMKPLLTYFTVPMPELLHHLLMLVYNKCVIQCIYITIFKCLLCCGTIYTTFIPNVLWIRNWQMLLHICWSDTACALTKWHHFFAWNDVMATILNAWHHIKNRTLLIDAFTWRTILPNFIAIRFEMTEPWLFLKSSPR